MKKEAYSNEVKALKTSIKSINKAQNYALFDPKNLVLLSDPEETFTNKVRKKHQG